MPGWSPNGRFRSLRSTISQASWADFSANEVTHAAICGHRRSALALPMIKRMLCRSREVLGLILARKMAEGQGLWRARMGFAGRVLRAEFVHSCTSRKIRFYKKPA